MGLMHEALLVGYLEESREARDVGSPREERPDLRLRGWARSARSDLSPKNFNPVLAIDNDLVIMFAIMQEKAPSRRPFLGMHFKCCKLYSRIYLNKKQTAFVGWCPKCASKVEVRVSPTGSDSQFFTAG